MSVPTRIAMLLVASTALLSAGTTHTQNSPPAAQNRPPFLIERESTTLEEKIWDVVTLLYGMQQGPPAVAQSVLRGNIGLDATTADTVLSLVNGLTRSSPEPFKRQAAVMCANRAVLAADPVALGDAMHNIQLEEGIDRHRRYLDFVSAIGPDTYEKLARWAQSSAAPKVHHSEIDYTKMFAASPERGSVYLARLCDSGPLAAPGSSN
jgi:hypothetical protein